MKTEKNVTSETPLALVTGAAHRLGRAIALALARQGYAIGLHYHHSEAEAGETAREIEALGVPVLRLQADLLEPAQIEDLFARVAGSGWPLRVLVNSAAVMPRADLRSISPEEWDATLALNLRAPLLCAQQAARLMDAPGARGGAIVNVSNSGALRAWTAFPAYMVSKAGLEIADAHPGAHPGAPHPRQRDCPRPGAAFGRHSSRRLGTLAQAPAVEAPRRTRGDRTGGCFFAAK